MEAIIFIGLQASGKTSFYQEQFSNTHLGLSLDMLKTRNRENILLESCLVAKQPFVVDNTNPTQLERSKYIKLAKQYKFTIKAYYFCSSLSGCLQRNAGREGKQKIPEVGVKGTYNKLEIPNYSEGFDALSYVSLVDGQFVVEEWKDEI